MNCPFCKTSIPDNITYCPYCGNVFGDKVKEEPKKQKSEENKENNSQQYQGERNSLRQSELSALDRLITHFSQKQHAYDEYDRVTEKLRYYERGSSSALIVWGSIIFTFSGFIWFFSRLVVYLYLGIIPSVLMIFGGILIKANNASKCNRYEQEYKRLSLELCNHFMLYPNCPLPAEYTNPRILYVFMNTIQYGRADSIREAVNYVLGTINSHNYSLYMSEMQRYTGRINYETGVSVIFVPSYLFA